MKVSDVDDKITEILEAIYSLADYRYLYNTDVDNELESAIQHLRNAQDCLE